MFKGSMVALVTPMFEDGAIDKASFEKLIDWHIAAKTTALIIAGTTGESATLTDSEKLDTIALALKKSNKRIPIIAGTGSNSTQHTIDFTKQAEKIGADAALIVTPYYNKPTQEGLFEHFRNIAENTALPIILYNVPGRTACDLLPETVARLTQFKNIIGIKEATGKVERSIEIAKLCGKDFLIFSGDDATSLELMLNGGHGVISVTANIAPEKMSVMCEAALSGDKELAHQINTLLMPLHKNLFLESNPIPTKWALAEMGKIPKGIRLPLSPFHSKYHAELKAALVNAGIQ